VDPLGSLHLSVALDGAGWHPAAWREPAARPAELLTARYWVDLIQEAERGLLDFVTIEDGLSLQSSRPGRPDRRTDQLRGRLDAVLIAARAAPVTRHVGLVPTVIATHTEPFHISKAIATLDYASTGRAGVRIRLSLSPHEAAHFGRRSLFPHTLPAPALPAPALPAPALPAPALPALDLADPADRGRPEVRELIADAFDEAADYVEVVRRLWDSWEDDAEIRDAAAGRFIDTRKLHYIGFEGRWFSVKGPSITPRPPQGQPVVAALGHAAVPYRLIAGAADVGFVTPHDARHAAEIVAEIRAAQDEAGRAAETVHVFGDLVVFLGPDARTAASRKDRLDALAGARYESDALIFTGTAPDLADLLQDWQRAGLAGFRLRPGAIPDDLEAITRDLVPELQRRGAFRRGYEARTLRGLLGLGRPASRYAGAGAGATEDRR
jgi:alkanesulfonate monooxygenase SsuD/methylene tetrahydromethanopterin reductase-like flavin-dependent oxidoreductase (luciferase family)